MIIPIKDKALCEVISREKILSSGIIIPDKIKDKKDNVVRCIGVGSEVKMVRRGDLVHYNYVYGQKLTYEGKRLVFVKEKDVIAIERGEYIIALGSMVIVRLKYADKIGTIVVPDNAKQNSGDVIGEVVSAGPEYPDRLVKGDEVWFLRGEGYRFRTFESREDLYSVKEVWIYARKD